MKIIVFICSHGLKLDLKCIYIYRCTFIFNKYIIINIINIIFHVYPKFLYTHTFSQSEINLPLKKHIIRVGVVAQW